MYRLYRSYIGFAFIVIFIPGIHSNCVISSPSIVTCEKVAVLSGNYIKEVVSDFDSIKKIIVDNNDEELQVSSSTFKETVHLEKVYIKHSQMWKVWAFTYVNMPLVIIDLSWNAIKLIEKEAFSNLPKLDRLVLRHNKLPDIGTSVFTKLPISVLSLSHNLITTIEEFALEHLPNLKVLHLDNNLLTSVDIHKYLTYPEKLEVLWLHNNSIKAITRNMLHNLNNLRVLNLAYNQIEVVDANSFQNSQNLKTLILSHNIIKQLDPEIFSSTGLSYMENLYLDNNRLMFLSTKFFILLKRLKRITLVGNPWICKCLEKVRNNLMENFITEKCNEHFLDGTRPVCVGNDYDNCNFVYKEDLSQTYYQALSENIVHLRPVDCILGSSL